jgi:hypothetical protein
MNGNINDVSVLFWVRPVIWRRLRLRGEDDINSQRLVAVGWVICGKGDVTVFVTTMKRQADRSGRAV